MNVVSNQNINTTSWTSKLSSWFYSSDLETRIKSIASKNLLAAEEKKELKKAVQHSYSWSWGNGRMRNLLKSILKQEHIQQLIDDDLSHASEKEIMKNLQLYLSLFDKDFLLNLSGFKTSANTATRFCNHGLMKKSVLKSNLEKEGKALFKEFWVEFKHFFHMLLDILLSASGIKELGSEKHSRHSEHQMDGYVALRKIEAYTKLIGFPVFLFGVILTFIEFQSIAFAMTAAAVIASIILLVLYQRYWKPCPKDQFGLRNINLELLRSKDPIFPRDDILSEIEKAFKKKKGVILVGDPGVGKSSIPPSLIDQIEKGRKCTFIKNPQLFACCASKFKTESYESPTFDTIAERFKRYNEQVIFFFDEFHSMLDAQGPNEKSQKDAIKPFADEFRYIIGATTKQEYDTFVKDIPTLMGRRFVKVDVGVLEDKQIHMILDQYLKTRYPKIAYDENVLNYIIDNATKSNPKTSKIDAAQTLLNLAIEKIDTIEFKDFELKIHNLKFEKKLIKQKLSHSKIGQDDALIQEFKEKQQQIALTREQLAKKKERVDRMRKIEAYYIKFIEQSYRMANEKVALKENSPLERQWIELLTKIEVIKKFLSKERTELNLPQCLDQAFIDTLL